MLSKDVHRNYVVKKATLLGKISGKLFLTGFILSRGQNVPNPIIASGFRALSLLSYTSGYVLWIIASRFYPKQKHPPSHWYGFTSFKDQHLYSAIAGVLGCIMSMAALFVPGLLVIASWIFLISNILWAVAEFHRHKNPLAQDTEHKANYRKAYSNYALIMTSIAAVAALTSTCVFFLPALSIPLLAFSSLLVLALNMQALEFWLSFNYGKDKPKPMTKQSSISDTLKPEPTPKSSIELKPYHGPSLFKELPTQVMDDPKPAPLACNSSTTPK